MFLGFISFFGHTASPKQEADRLCLWHTSKVHAKPDNQFVFNKLWR